MDTELATLEEKIRQTARLCQRLRDENRGLRQQLAALQGDKRQLAEKIDGAKSTRDPAQADPRITFRMNQKSKTLDVTIMGRTYKVACTEEERNALLSAVAYLDRKMSEIKSTGRVASAERIADR